MNQKKAIGFGFRGLMLILFQAVAYITYQVFTQYPLNILADFYGGATVVSKYYSICAVVGIFIQLLLVGPISRLKNLKAFCCTLGGVTLVLAFFVMSQPVGPIWYICYSLINVTAVLYATMTLGLLVGQWFPTRKGTVMGIATLAFPIANGLLGPFAGSVFGPIGAMTAQGIPFDPNQIIMKAFLPFFIVSIIGWLIGVIFIKDYPEQVGAFRDNDKSMTPEVANTIMMAEIENKKTSVWTIGHVIKNRDFWFFTITNALLLGTAIGLMSQSQAIVTNAPKGMPEYAIVMAMIMIFGIIGSFGLGLLDTKIGTRKAMIIATCLMIIAGILGTIGSGTSLLIAMIFVALFMGAASNFGVSCAAQYWRREDFGRIFMISAPIGSLIASASPAVIAGLLFGMTGYKGSASVFILVGVCGVIALACMLIFNPNHIKTYDNKLRANAGKELDEALVGRK